MCFQVYICNMNLFVYTKTSDKEATEVFFVAIHLFTEEVVPYWVTKEGGDQGEKKIATRTHIAPFWNKVLMFKLRAFVNVSTIIVALSHYNYQYFHKQLHLNKKGNLSFRNFRGNFRGNFLL